MLVQVVILEGLPQVRGHLEQGAEAGGLLAAAAAQVDPDFLVLLGGHRLQQAERLDHQFLRQVHPAEEGEDAVGVLPLEVVVDVEQRVGDQLHPQLFRLVDDLELQFVLIAEILEIFLAGEQLLGVQVELVVERALAVDDGVEILPVHKNPLRDASARPNPR